jgi:thiol-disulfide isomerase/thioredoxin
MKQTFQTQRFRKLVLTIKPWAIFIGIIFLLKVTGLMSSISFFTGTAIMKTGIMDVHPETSLTPSQNFNYNFTVKDLSGKSIEMSDLKGKVIFLNLWATWCGPCRVEMPSIQSLYNSIDHDKIAFVMLSLDQAGQQQRVVQFIKDKEFTFPVYLPASSLPTLLRVNTIPATFVIGQDGKVKLKKSGTSNYDTEAFREFLKELTK